MTTNKIILKIWELHDKGLSSRKIEAKLLEEGIKKNYKTIQRILKKPRPKKPVPTETKVVPTPEKKVTISKKNNEVKPPSGFDISVFDLPDYQEFLRYVKANSDILKGLCLEDTPTKTNPNPKKFDKVGRAWKRIIDDTIKVYRKIIEDKIQGKWENA